MEGSKAQNDWRSALNRMASLDAGQQQLRAEAEAIRTAVKSLQWMLLYLIVLAGIIYYLLSRKGAPA